MSLLSHLLFCNDTATTEIVTYGHTHSLHDALPISSRSTRPQKVVTAPVGTSTPKSMTPMTPTHPTSSSERSKARSGDAVSTTRAGTRLSTPTRPFAHSTLGSRGSKSLDRKSTRLNSRH